MGLRKVAVVLALVTAMTLVLSPTVGGGQLWVKCHITCRCQHDDSVGNFLFTIPIDVSADTPYDSDWACRIYGNRVCADGCNGTKFTYTYQVVGP
jgi:hypothetical protein